MKMRYWYKDTQFSVRTGAFARHNGNVPTSTTATIIGSTGADETRMNELPSHGIPANTLDRSQLPYTPMMCGR